MPLLEPQQPVEKISAGVAADCRNVVFEHQAQDCAGCRGHKGRPAEGGCMGTRSEGLCHLFTGQHRAHRQAVGQSLGQGHDIRLDAEVFISKQSPCPPHPGLDFIENQKRAGFVAKRAHGFEIAGVRAAHAALALDRFEQHGGGSVIELGFKTRHVIERHKIKPAEHRIEPFADLLLTGCREGRHGAPVKRLVHGNNPETVGIALLVEIFAGQLDGRFIGFGPTVAEKNPVRETVCHQKSGHIGLWFSVEKVGDVHQPSRLFGHGTCDGRVGMPQVAHRNAGHKVEVGLAGFVPECTPLTLWSKQSATFCRSPL